MKNYYICINRQFGSLGRPIARALSEILGIEYYDRDIIEAAAEKTDMPLKHASEVEEKVQFRFAYMSHPLGIGAVAEQNKIFEAERDIILQFAAKGSAIFVGRCAEYILREKNCLNVFIYAPEEERYQNCVNSLDMEPAEARETIASVDKARDNYWMKYAKYLPSDLEHNHLMIDSSLLGVKGTAQLLAEIAQKYFGLAGREKNAPSEQKAASV
ncbi:MAG: cytidylate kinase-like family protein [Lachnospiraceae bacterium]|nr:cytidylate kinase-like family protein [Lachnospiraceae bacterium]